MPADFGKTFSSAFKYAFAFRRILPFFLINLILVAFIFIFIDSATNLLPLLVSNAWSSIPISTILYATLIFLAVIAVTTLMRIFFQATITDNARFYWQKKKKGLSKSFPTGRKYITVLFALILAGIISSFVSAILQYIPIGGVFLAMIASILLGLIFLFLIQIIVISNKGVVNSLKEGYRLFMRNKLDVFLFWLVLIILSLLILLVAIIPILIAAVPIIGLLIESVTAGSAILENLIPLIKSNMLSLGIASIISSLILAYMSVFQESAKTFFYMQKKK